MAAPSALSTRRRLLFDASLDRIASRWAELGELTKRAADRIVFRSENGTEILVQLAAVKGGYGFKSGELGVYSTFIVSRGPIAARMKKLRAFGKDVPADERFWMTTSHAFTKSGALYELRARHDPAKLAAKIAADAERFAAPAVRGLVTIDWRAISGAILRDAEAFERPFGTALAVASLANRKTALRELWKKTERIEAVWDRPDATKLQALLDKP